MKTYFSVPVPPPSASSAIDFAVRQLKPCRRDINQVSVLAPMGKRFAVAQPRRSVLNETDNETLKSILGMTERRRCSVVVKGVSEILGMHSRRDAELVYDKPSC